MDAASHEDIRFHRLPVEPLFELAVAVVGGIALSAAGEVLVKRLVGVVEAVLLEIEAVRAKRKDLPRRGAQDCSTIPDLSSPEALPPQNPKDCCAGRAGSK